MAKKAEAIIFEAALSPTRACFTLGHEGDAQLVLTVPASAVAPLSLAMARGELNERTFLVEIKL